MVWKVLRKAEIRKEYSSLRREPRGDDFSSRRSRLPRMTYKCFLFLYYFFTKLCHACIVRAISGTCNYGSLLHNLIITSQPNGKLLAWLLEKKKSLRLYLNAFWVAIRVSASLAGKLPNIVNVNPWNPEYFDIQFPFPIRCSTMDTWVGQTINTAGWSVIFTTLELNHWLNVKQKVVW